MNRVSNDLHESVQPFSAPFVVVPFCNHLEENCELSGTRRRNNEIMMNALLLNLHYSRVPRTQPPCIAPTRLAPLPPPPPVNLPSKRPLLLPPFQANSADALVQVICDGLDPRGGSTLPMTAGGPDAMNSSSTISASSSLEKD